MKKHIMLFVILGAFFLCSCSSESQSNLPDNSRNESVQLNSNMISHKFTLSLTAYKGKIKGKKIP